MLRPNTSKPWPIASAKITTRCLRYDRSKMDKRGQLSYDILEYFLRIQIEGDKFRDYDFPVNQMFGVQSTLPNFMAQQHQVTMRRKPSRTSRACTNFPEKFDQVIASLKLRESKNIIPPQFLVEKVLAQMDGFIASTPKENPLYSTFKEKLDKIPDQTRWIRPPKDKSLADVESSIQQDVYPSYQKTDRLLQGACSRKRRAISARGICRTAMRITRGACVSTQRRT